MFGCPILVPNFTHNPKRFTLYSWVLWATESFICLVHGCLSTSDMEPLGIWVTGSQVRGVFDHDQAGVLELGARWTHAKTQPQAMGAGERLFFGCPKKSEEGRRAQLGRLDMAVANRETWARLRQIRR